MEHETKTAVDDILPRRAHGRADDARWKWAAGGAGAVLLIGAVLWWAFGTPSVSTDDAFVEAHVIPVSARVAGHAARVLVDDNQQVKAGDLLVELDPRDFRTRVDRDRAKLEAARASAAKDAADLERAQALFARDEASRQDLDHARAEADAAKAEVAQAEAELAQAELDLSYTKIVAPQDGRVTRKSVEPGSYVSVGQAALALVSKESWVVANFKETQLTKMRPGQRAEIKVDAYPDRVLRGKVDSIQDGTGARFSLLPAENASGNFVKVVQRVPVKIVLDDDLGAGRTLAPGMSVDATVELK